MTEKLYYTDAYLKDFSAKVLSCDSTDDGFSVVLDKTAFFPMGGGQGSDVGFINGVLVYDVREKDGKVFHLTKEKLGVGESVTCSVDFEARFKKMQMHTAEHIVSGVIHSLFGFDNVGFHLGSDGVTLDINGALSREDLDKVEDIANGAVYKNVPVTCRIISKEEIATLEYRSKLELTENVRVVTVEGYDNCACCAPHVSRTGEIGVIKLLDFIKYKGGVRIHMLAGWAALEDYRRKFTVLQAISNSLSAPPHDCDTEVERVLKELSLRDFELRSARGEIAKRLAASIEENDGNLVIYEKDFSIDELRTVATEAVKKIGGILVLLGGEEGNLKYVIASNTNDLKCLIPEINKALSGKGGGRPEMAQGSFACTSDEVRKYFLNSK